MDADVQLGLYPDFVCKVDELAFDFDNWYRTSLQYDDQYTDARSTAMKNIDERLKQISGEGNSHLWTEEALRSSHVWSGIRELAEAALVSFGWEIEEPPPSENVYVPG